MNWYPQTGISSVICFIARLFDAAASDLSLIAGGLRINGPFPLGRFYGWVCAAHHREPDSPKQGCAASLRNERGR
jgi:hypothetical protein